MLTKIKFFISSKLPQTFSIRNKNNSFSAEIEDRYINETLICRKHTEEHSNEHQQRSQSNNKKEIVLNLLVRSFIFLVMKLPFNYCVDEGEVFL